MEENKIKSSISNSTNELSFNLKYITNKQDLAWYTKQEYPIKKCDFCTMLASKKESTHSLTKTEVSLFEGHELLISNNHAGEYLGEHLKHMLDLIEENNNAAIAFEGSRNASIKNYHFSCHYISDKNQLPIITDINNDIFKEVISQDSFSVGILNVYGRNPIIIKSPSISTISDAFYALENKIGVNFSINKHPYINIVIWKDGENYILAAIPRVVYKPTEYYDENNKWDIAPGVLEMCGVYLISNHDEYLHMTAEQLLQITDEVSYNDTHILEILEGLELSKIK